MKTITFEETNGKTITKITVRATKKQQEILFNAIRDIAVSYIKRNY